MRPSWPTLKRSFAPASATMMLLGRTNSPKGSLSTGPPARLWLASYAARSARARAALAGLGDEEPASPDPDQASRAVQVGRDDRHGGSCCARRRGADRRQRQNACSEDDEEPSSKHVLPPSSG